MPVVRQFLSGDTRPTTRTTVAYTGMRALHAVRSRFARAATFVQVAKVVKREAFSSSQRDASSYY